jgi:hypothetical protein
VFEPNFHFPLRRSYQRRMACYPGQPGALQQPLAEHGVPGVAAAMDLHDGESLPKPRLSVATIEEHSSLACARTPQALPACMEGYLLLVAVVWDRTGRREDLGGLP